mmetsp:Transcript_12009/g.15011  ORF Transcript_12009/g.15011 Transcript_12009/m.15011 type:complete len:117 (+) Transcript_12009:481-831(+)
MGDLIGFVKRGARGMEVVMPWQLIARFVLLMKPLCVPVAIGIKWCKLCRSRYEIVLRHHVWANVCHRLASFTISDLVNYFDNKSDDRVRVVRKENILLRIMPCISSRSHYCIFFKA